MSKIKVGDTVKIIGTTIVGDNRDATPIPIGTICNVTAVDIAEDGIEYFSVLGDSPKTEMFGEYLYTEDALEKGKLVWIKGDD